MLIKNSPFRIYRHSANTVEVSGWLMADDFGNPEKEQKHLQEQSVINDWSHLGKISLSGTKASSDAEKMIKAQDQSPEYLPIRHRLRSDLQNDYLLLAVREQKASTS